ncbi:MAG: hypothetical protein CMJ49_00750 [Planctomycetaceae bacterium]|nr:hypothetical protein [Planctomycetaceae bacterium]
MKQLLRLAVGCVLVLGTLSVTGCGGGGEDHGGAVRNETPVDKENRSSDVVVQRVAAAYYSQMEQIDVGRQQQEAQDGQSDEPGPAPPPSSATGRVVDRRGMGIGGADVLIESEVADPGLGQGKTDEDGRFDVPLEHTAYRGLDVIVTREGYERSAYGSIYGGMVDFELKLDRKIDGTYLRSVVACENREERLWMLLEIIGDRQMDPVIQEIYPFLGDLRADLLDVVRSGGFDAIDDGRSSPAERAREFLELWHDPADASLFSDAAPADISGETIEEVCAKWADHHFEEMTDAPRTHNWWFDDPIYGPDEQHALIRFGVMYAHWGYSQLLVLVRHDQVWQLGTVKEHLGWHNLREPDDG